jgi:hypothetical protein
LNTRIEREFSFQAAVYFEGSFIMNVYALLLSMEVETDSMKEQAIAMDRIEYFLSECIANSVFVESTEKRSIEKYSNADIKVCTLPEEPYDQIITILLLQKLNSITEGRLSITDIVLKSELSDGVKFIYNVEEANLHPFGKGWWSEANTNITDVLKSNRKDKIVKLVKTNDCWSIADLEWEEKSSNTAKILFTTDPDKQP